jgi:hypothetical protein
VLVIGSRSVTTVVIGCVLSVLSLHLVQGYQLVGLFAVEEIEPILDRCLQVIRAVHTEPNSFRSPLAQRYLRIGFSPR